MGSVLSGCVAAYVRVAPERSGVLCQMPVVRFGESELSMLSIRTSSRVELLVLVGKGSPSGGISTMVNSVGEWLEGLDYQLNSTPTLIRKVLLMLIYDF